MGNESSEKVGRVLVAGAGIAGIRAALELAESDHQVYLLDSSPYIGGTLSELERQFPTNDCGICKILPSFGSDSSAFCFRRGVYHKNIELITGADVVACEGHAGDFTVRVRKAPEHVDSKKCIACGDCVPVCEVEVLDEGDKLNLRKAIYIKNPLAYPNVYTIDEKRCNRCGKCVKICPTKAVDLDAKAREEELHVGAIVLGVGFEKVDPDIKKEYGYGHYANVVTNIELERALGQRGPDGRFTKIDALNKMSPKIAFLQCVGSRESGRNYCSASCCMIALKEAVMLKEINPKAEIKIFFMDMRAYGKGYYRYYQRAKELGVEFIHCRAPAIEELPDKTLEIRYATDEKDLIRERFSLAVLSVGQSPSRKMKALSEALGVSLNDFAFVKSPPFYSVKTSREGIFACGSITAPKDIGRSVTEAIAAAAQASLFVPGRKESPSEEKRAGARAAKPRIGVFVCRCGKEIADAVDIDGLLDFAKSRPGVAFAEAIDFLCVDLGTVKERIARSDANAIVFASCAPYSLERGFHKALSDVGIDSGFLEIVNLREQLSCAHRAKGDETEKARSLINVAIEKLRDQENALEIREPVVQRALVLGGGIAGMNAALILAGNDIDVELVEKTDALGGILRDIHYTVEPRDPQAFLRETIEQVESHPRIRVHRNAQVESVSGHAGNFKVTLASGGATQALAAGAIIIATGANAFVPKEYLYKQRPDVVTQKELENALAKGDFSASTVVMIQCVGSREQEENNYCSKICCTEAVKNAIKIKELRPETEIYMLYRDIMTYGFKEDVYRQAREKGVFLVRYPDDHKPKVTADGGSLKVSIPDYILKKRLVMKPDLLVLSTGLLPNGDNGKIAEMLGLKLDEDGYFEEANPKFRPVDFLKDGIFVCGTAHSPMDIGESITQASAAAGRALTLLSRKEVLTKKIVSEVAESFCAACQLCVAACPYEARVLDEGKRVVAVVSALCQGCGVCAMVCPNGASKLRGQSARQILSMIDGAVA